MDLYPQIADRNDSTAVVMLHLKDGDTETEIAFRSGLTDVADEQPDFVVPLEDIAVAVPEAVLELADDGLALRVMAEPLGPTIHAVTRFVQNACEAHYGPVHRRGLQTV